MSADMENIAAAAAGEGSAEAAVSPVDGYPTLTKADIRHNMSVIIMLDAVFTTGIADLVIVGGPLMAYLGASNFVAGLLQAFGFLGLIGIFVSPWISVHCKFKKWYLFFTHLPYIGTWGLMGLGVLMCYKLQAWFPSVVGQTNEELFKFLLGYLLVLSGINGFFGGFVQLPHQEYVAACIPMTHRGRYSSWSQGIGAVFSFGSTALGGWILLVAESPIRYLEQAGPVGQWFANLIMPIAAKPMAFGVLYILAWFFCQAGYIMALFGRERPTPIEKAPKPWTKGMFLAAWNDKPFIKLMVVHFLFVVIYYPLCFTYFQLYGFKKLGLIAAMAPFLMMLQNITRVGLSGPIGILTDKLHPKRMLVIWPVFMIMSILPVTLIKPSSQVTNNDLDLFIEGDGYFRIVQPDGQLAYTRMGAFDVDPQGRLVTREGRLALADNITLPVNYQGLKVSVKGKFALAENGVEKEFGGLQLARFSNPHQLQDIGGGFFRPTKESGDPQLSTPGTESLGEIAQKTIEVPRKMIYFKLIGYDVYTSWPQIGVMLAVALQAPIMLGLGAAFLALIYGIPKPENRSGHYTIQMIENTLAFTVGPLVIGKMMDKLGYQPTFIIVAILIVGLIPLSQYMLKGISGDARDYA